MKVEFETATIADSIKKAARVAPTKGEAFDKASGVMMELDVEEQTVTLRSTNLEIFYLEVVQALEITGLAEDQKAWRFNAAVISEVFAKLPIGSGKTVSLEQVHNEVHMKAGRTTAKFRIMDHSYYPEWEPFDPEKLELVSDFGARIRQVEWAAQEGNDTDFSGIHLTGKIAAATDRFRLAIVDCEAEPIYKPITIPAGILKPVLADMRDVAIGIDEGRFLLMPNVSTQVSTRIYDKQYPAVEKLIQKDWPNQVTFKKSELLAICERAAIFARTDRDPIMTFIIGKGEIAVMCADQDMGLLGDAIELTAGQADHARLKILFTPKNLMDAITSVPSEEAILHYDQEKGTVPCLIDGGSGYHALVMPRKDKQ